MANIEEGVSSLRHNMTEVDNSLSETLMDIKDAVQDLNSSMIESLSRTGAANCKDLLKIEINTTEPVQIYPYTCCPDHSEDVVCNQQLDQGGWTIIQRRQDVRPRENFYRGMSDYVRGFGMLSGEFWIGLKLIHELTTQSKQELHITLEDWDGNVRWARYSTFKIGSAEDKYRLTVSGYSGDAGDALAYHQGQAFTTFDEDNDPHTGAQCAEYRQGAWWYKTCANSNLNGKPITGSDSSYTGIFWVQWLGFGYSLRSTSMMIRPAAH
ncbi:unnamed protein product [Meganyctiphanes norvegica]|uniref:Fibrinogen C-terminal domain-containing protein n=1 Tax=Meganyctiphanes norvegica TaxID=48144 RepID=A0AAV2SQA3_MEGNR